VKVDLRPCLNGCVLFEVSLKFSWASFISFRLWMKDTWKGYARVEMPNPFRLSEILLCAVIDDFLRSIYFDTNYTRQLTYGDETLSNPVHSYVSVKFNKFSFFFCYIENHIYFVAIIILDYCYLFINFMSNFS
jgi:hypothetical protein